MADVTIQSLWPTTLGSQVWDDHESMNPMLLEACYRIRGKEANFAEQWTNKPGIYESSFNFLATDGVEMLRLRDFLAGLIVATVARVNADAWRQAGGNSLRLRVHFKESWFHITNGGGFHDVHSHPGCSWCGVYYVNSGRPLSPTSSGVTRFYDPRPVGGLATDAATEYLGIDHSVVPTDGLAIVFPSYLRHAALPYAGEGDRVTIAFNAIVNVEPSTVDPGQTP